MHIESLSIRNFRCFGNEAVQINLAAGTNAFVGNNGAGKTAALEALKRLFSPIAAERQIRLSDVHFGPGEDIHTIKGSEREIVIEAVFGFPGNTTNAQVFTDLFFNGIDNSLKVRVRLECKYSSANAIDDDLETKFYAIRTLDAVPFGPDDERKTPLRGRPTQYAEVVYIPAHRDSRGVSQTALRNLLQRLERSADWDEDTKLKSKGFAEDLQKNLNATPALKLVTKTLEGFWASLHDGHYDGKVELGVIATEFQKLIRDLTLRFTKAPGGGQRQLEELSEGQTSLLYFALSASLHKLMSDMQKAAPKKLDGFLVPDFVHPPLTIFALEEPENHLAPFYLPKLISLLDTLNKDGSAQAIVTSHATSILSRIPPRHVRYFRNDPSSLTSRALALPLPKRESDEDKFVQQVILANPEIYFARLVIVGEGDTERLVIPKVAEALGVSLDPSFIAYVSIGGRHAQHLWRLLNGLNIPHITLLDFDLGRTGGGLGRVKNAVGWMTDLGASYIPTWPNDNQQEVPATAEAVAAAPALTTTSYLPWVHWLRRWNIFYSAPVDLDMMMLQAFPDAYKPDTPCDPNVTPAEVARLETSVFKKGAGRAEIQAVGLSITNEQLHAYDDLFKSSSKPGSHLLAFTKLTNEEIRTNCPEPLKAVVARAMEMISAKAKSGDGA